MKVALKVTPGARKNEILGWEEDYPQVGRVLKLKIAAPPVEGRANKAIEIFLAGLLDLPRTGVSVVHGASGRLKWVELPDEADLSLLKPR